MSFQFHKVKKFVAWESYVESENRNNTIISILLNIVCCTVYVLRVIFTEHKHVLCMKCAKTKEQKKKIVV